jgi:hypothetical protein
MAWRIRRYVPQGPSPFLMGQIPIWFDAQDCATTDDPLVVEVASYAPELYEITDLEEEARAAVAAAATAARAEPEPESEPERREGPREPRRREPDDVPDPEPREEDREEERGAGTQRRPRR